MPVTAVAAPATQQQSLSRARMSLGNVVTGVIPKPLRVLLYGVDGIGKTTLAANSESPIFIGTEDGSSTLDVPRFPEPESWLDVLAAVDELTATEHSYRTLVIDTLDWLEPHCWEHVCATKRDKRGQRYTSIEDIPYNRGYVAALDEWRILLSRLDRARSLRGMQIILIAHTWIKPFKNPAGDDFDRFEIKLHAKASGLLREWSDVVLFATHEQYTHETDSGRVKGISTGARIMQTERTAAWDAKNRHNLPAVLPLDWGALVDAIAAHQQAEPAELRARIVALLEGALLEGADESLHSRVTAAMERVGDNAGELARIANKLAAQVGIKQQEQAT